MVKETENAQSKQVKKTKKKGLKIGLIIGGIIAAIVLIVVIVQLSAGPKIKLSIGSVGGNFQLDLLELQDGKDVAGMSVGGKEIAGKTVKFHITSNYTEMDKIECQVISAGKEADSSWTNIASGSADITLDIPPVIGEEDRIECTLDANFQGLDLLRTDINYEIEY